VTVDAFGAMLRALRTARGLSQNGLSVSSGVDPAYINRMERAGQRTKTGRAIAQEHPSRAIVRALADGLELSDADADRLLYVAGHAPHADWQARCEAAEAAIAAIRDLLDPLASTPAPPAFIRAS
jgi:transcriptional regulator with XRE-family HTH domain